MCKDDEELAWCAGYLDGDGSFNISVSRVSLAPCISATSKEPEPLDELFRIFGGHLSIVHHSVSGKEYWHWRVRQSDVVDVCRMLIPFLVLKREQAELMVEAWEGRGALPAGRRGYNLDEVERDAVLSKRQEYCTTMSALNGIER